MSISDLIVVMKDGVINQIDKPQAVYDDPDNLFVAKFLGTPPINVFEGHVKNGALYAGDDHILDITGVDDRDVWVGIRPEGFVYAADGPLKCALTRVEVMGRDVSVVSTHPSLSGVSIRSIISAEIAPQIGGEAVRFAVKPAKVHIFDRATEERIRFSVR